MLVGIDRHNRRLGVRWSEHVAASCFKPSPQPLRQRQPMLFDGCDTHPFKQAQRTFELCHRGMRNRRVFVLAGVAFDRKLQIVGRRCHMGMPEPVRRYPIEQAVFYIQKRHPKVGIQPLVAPTCQEVDVSCRHINHKCAHRLDRIDITIRTMGMCNGGYLGHIVAESIAVRHP